MIGKQNQRGGSDGRLGRAQSDGLAEGLFRERWRDVVAALAARFGPSHLDAIEDAVQTAFLRALDRWSIGGVPENPGGWIYTVARNRLLDRLRHQQSEVLTDQVPEPTSGQYAAEPLCDWTGPLADEVYRMILVCAAPVLRPRESLVITLRLVCGLGLHEIARGMLLSDDAAAKLLVRAKQRLRDAHLSLDPPDGRERGRRLDRVLQTIYLLYNAGYDAPTGETALRIDLCREAERLIDLVLESEGGAAPRAWALAALMSFQSSRLGARVSEDGTPILLSKQDRSRWNQAKIGRAFGCLDRSIGGPDRSRYHLEAAIAASHAAALRWEETDWAHILSLYDDLLTLSDTPIVRLNRAVAVSMVRGPDAALDEIGTLASDRRVTKNPLLHALRADLLQQKGDMLSARAAFAEAAALSRNKSVRTLLNRRMGDLSI